MGIPNIPSLYQKIGKGGEGGSEFARLITSLIIAECQDSKDVAVVTSDASGDFQGVDLVRHSEDLPIIFFAGYQFKFYPQALSASQRSEIKASFQRAYKKNQGMHSWILVTPDDLLAKDMQWFQSLVDEIQKPLIALEHNGSIYSRHFSLEHWGKSKITSRLLRYPHIGRHYFPELYHDAEGKLMIESINIDSKLCTWEAYESGSRFFANHSPHIGTSKSSSNKAYKNKTSDPIFDIMLVNNSGNLFLLKEIVVVSTKVWTVLSGLPHDRLLKSLGTIQMSVNLNEEFSSYIFPDPLIFPPKSPIRFGLQFDNIRCSGNRASFYFRFHFSEDQYLESKEYTFAL